MATDPTIISMCDLSSWATSSIISGGTLHWRYVHNHPWGRTFNIIVGDRFFDRITFWNARLLVDPWHIGAGHLVALRLPENRLRAGEFMEAFLSFLTSRKWMLSFGSPNQPHLTIRSNTVIESDLNSVSEAIRARLRCPVNQAPIRDIIDACPIPEQLSVDRPISEDRGQFVAATIALLAGCGKTSD